jgi:hypothetical protein
MLEKKNTPVSEDHDDKYGVPSLEELGKSLLSMLSGASCLCLAQKLFQLLVRLDFLNGKFTSLEKKSLVQIINNLLRQFKLKKKKTNNTKMVSFCNNVYFLTTFTKTNDKSVHSEWMYTSANEFINSGTLCLFRYVDPTLRFFFALSNVQRNSYV